MLAYVWRIHKDLKDKVCVVAAFCTLYLLYTSLCTGELNAIRKHKCFLCSPFYVKGVSLGYVRRTKT